MAFIKQFFTWWNSQTLNTRFYTWRKGERVGTDGNGNIYYRAKSAIPDSIPERRWVIFSGYSEASQVPSGWHGWLHHRIDVVPINGAYESREWEVPHQENATGSTKAYRPAGSIVGGGAHKPAKDYQAWQPK
jgi:NADH:ubiquinone oxidoreductase subunit